MAEDPIRTFSHEEQRRLTENLNAITTRVHAGGFRGRTIDRSLLLELHAAVFGGVRHHAGRIRNKEFGTDRLTFGPNRSTAKSKVPEELDRVLQETQQMTASLRNNRDDPDYEAKAVRIAVWAHARILQIHPFEDGNGRTSRLVLNHILVDAGLGPVAIEVVKKDYTDCLNEFFRSGNLQPAIDLFLRRMTD